MKFKHAYIKEGKEVPSRYVNVIGRHLERTLGRKKYKVDWEFDVDGMMGTFFWTHKDNDEILLYTTPYWEGADGIAVDLISNDGDVLYQAEIPWEEKNLTYDYVIDSKKFLQLIDGQFSKASKIIKQQEIKKL